jgi:hypothetical protein
MIAASLFDHPGYILLIAFVALVRWLASKAKTQTQTPQSPPAPPPPPVSRPIPRGGETQTEEERIRRFLEALGQPPGTTPPKVVTRRRPDLVSPLPPLKTKPPPLPKVAAPPPLPFETARVMPMTSRETVFEVREVARQTSSEPAPAQARSVPAARFNPRVKLGTPQDLRTAIVLREIFGPPRSLQPFDLSSVV